jgi:hypothetical protein
VSSAISTPAEASRTTADLFSTRRGPEPRRGTRPLAGRGCGERRADEGHRPIPSAPGAPGHYWAHEAPRPLQGDVPSPPCSPPQDTSRRSNPPPPTGSWHQGPAKTAHIECLLQSVAP